MMVPWMKINGEVGGWRGVCGEMRSWLWDGDGGGRG